MNKKTIPSILDTRTKDRETARLGADITIPDSERLDSNPEMNAAIMISIIHNIAQLDITGAQTTIRLSRDEHDMLQRFIHNHLYEHGLEGPEVSICKVMRYCTRYMLKVHPEEFVDALKRALRKDNELF